jgi:hypothetical protein
MKHLIDEPPTDDREPPPIRGESSGWIGGDCWTFRGFCSTGYTAAFAAASFASA